MAQNEDWAAGLVRVVAGEVRRYRQRRGLSAQQLADQCDELGMPIPRSVIANLENGRRPTLSLLELLILARALAVPPILLVFPIGREETIEVLPDRTVPTWEAAKWFTGEEPFPSPAESDTGWVAETFEDWQEGAAPVDMRRWHDRYVSRWRSAKTSANASRKAAERAETESERDALQRAVDADERTAREVEHTLRQHRQSMRAQELTVPELTPNLVHVDERVEVGK